MTFRPARSLTNGHIIFRTKVVYEIIVSRIQLTRFDDGALHVAVLTILVDLCVCTGMGMF